MKTHFCTKEKTLIDFSGTCNWCGAKEPATMNLFGDSPHVEVISDHLAWVSWVIVVLVLTGCAAAISFFIGKLV